MNEFLMTALPWICIAIALFAANHGASKEAKYHAFTDEMEATIPLMRRFIDLYSYARIHHCLSEPVIDPPEWMEHLAKRLRSKMNHMEKSLTP